MSYLEIDIFSDPICPWCFIGKKRLEKAIEARPDVNIDIRWRAFQLNPSMPKEGMDRQTYLEHKFGGPSGAAQVYGHIRDTGLKEGIDFNFEAIRRTPNTVNAHRLVRFAQAFSSQKAFDLVDLLFQAYFYKGRDIGQIEELIRLGEAVGLETENLSNFMLSSRFHSEIEEEDATARRLGISGVPFFIVNGQYALSGAQEPQAFDPIFDLAKQRPTQEQAQES